MPQDKKLSQLKKTKKTVTWPLRLDPAMREALALMAKAEDVNAADLVRFAIAQLPQYEAYLHKAGGGK